jgi:hypothetical protein
MLGAGIRGLASLGRGCMGTAVARPGLGVIGLMGAGVGVAAWGWQGLLEMNKKGKRALKKRMKRKHGHMTTARTKN